MGCKLSCCPKKANSVLTTPRTGPQSCNKVDAGRGTIDQSEYLWGDEWEDQLRDSEQTTTASISTLPVALLKKIFLMVSTYHAETYLHPFPVPHKAPNPPSSVPWWSHEADSCAMGDATGMSAGVRAYREFDPLRSAARTQGPGRSFKDRLIEAVRPLALVCIKWRDIVGTPAFRRAQRKHAILYGDPYVYYSQSPVLIHSDGDETKYIAKISILHTDKQRLGKELWISILSRPPNVVVVYDTILTEFDGYIALGGDPNSDFELPSTCHPISLCSAMVGNAGVLAVLYRDANEDVWIQTIDIACQPIANWVVDKHENIIEHDHPILEFGDGDFLIYFADRLSVGPRISYDIYGNLLSTEYPVIPDEEPQLSGLRSFVIEDGYGQSQVYVSLYVTALTVRKANYITLPEGHWDLEHFDKTRGLLFLVRRRNWSDVSGRYGLFIYSVYDKDV